MMKQQQGFTLIELIVVIVILGILAATALPKFVSLQQNARLASVQGAAGAMSSAAALAHAAYLVSGAASNASVTMDGSTVTMSNGYPTADANGIETAANLVGNSAYTLSGANPLLVEGAGAATPAVCAASYTPATTTLGAQIVAPTTAVLSSC